MESALRAVLVFQGGMGVDVSRWTLALSVAQSGRGRAAGIVSDTLIGHVAAARISAQDADWLRALKAFAALIPEAADMLGTKFSTTRRVLQVPLYTITDPPPLTRWLTIFGAFANLFLAGEGHSYPIGVNVLEKVGYPHLECFYGTLLAMMCRPSDSTTFIIAGAGLNYQFPKALEDLAHHGRATYTIPVLREQEGGGEAWSTHDLRFDIHELVCDYSTATQQRLRSLALRVPLVISIVTTYTAVQLIEKKAGTGIAGYVVENHMAGGHNANPRQGDAYGIKDEMDYGKLRALGKPFWCAGNFGSPEGLERACALGACGVQVGSLFVPAVESGLAEDLKNQILARIKDNSLTVVRDRRSSPTTYMFMVAEVDGTVTDPAVSFERACIISHLRIPVVKLDGVVTYRCSAEPEDLYLEKGGRIEDTIDRDCLCRQLFAAAGYKRVDRFALGEYDPAIVTLGLFALQQIQAFLKWKEDAGCENTPYTAQEVVHYLLEGVRE